jgi:monoamine oxidase
MSSSSPQVLIIGGGFSGIAAAKKLAEAGISFLVLEARERLGGRVYTKSFSEDLYLDLGGQWIGPTQDRMYQLCEEFGMETFETYDQGKNILDLGGKIRTYSGLIPKMDPISLINLDLILKKLERLARQIDINSPWQHPKAADFDAVSLDYFIRKYSYTPSCLEVIRVGCATVFACELNEISLLHALFYIRSGTSLETLINIKNGAQQHRIKGGMQPLVEQMALPFLDKIRFNSPVLEVEKKGKMIQVRGENFELNTQKLIFAVPPPLLAKIRISPELPVEKRQLLQRYSMGYVGKCFMIYKEPFWRQQGFSGQAVADENSPFQTLFDCSPADGKYGIMMGFTIGNRAKAYFIQSEEERKSQMREVLEVYFGHEAKKPIRYADFTMSDEIWSSGCYAGIMPTGAWTGFQDSYRKPLDPFYFAGTEASPKWNGYIEGAVLAGETASIQVINALRHA